jgi:glycosyltransferase involved in cell wall biosynthesis
LAGYDRFLDDEGVAYQIFEDRGPLDTRLVRAIGQFLEEWQPDIVQTHGYKPAGVAYLLRRLGRRIVWVGFSHGETDLGPKDRLYHRLHVILLRRADRIVVMSKRQLAPFRRMRDKVGVIHNAVLPMPSIERDEPNLASLSAFHDASLAPLIGVISRLSHEKGIDIFLDALSSLAREGAIFSAAIVGDGPLGADLESRAARVGLEQKLLFAGQVEAMHKVYPLLDLMVIPSRSEGLPNVLLEAMGADVPVVSTAVGAVPEILATEPDAFIMVPTPDPVVLAEGIRAALAEHARDPALRAKARAGLAKSLSLEQRVAHHVEVYSAVLAERSYS